LPQYIRGILFGTLIGSNETNPKAVAAPNLNIFKINSRNYQIL